MQLALTLWHKKLNKTNLSIKIQRLNKLSTLDPVDRHLISKILK